MDVVYVVRPGDQNEELRYALRSLVAHLPHDRVWIAGYKPAWCAGVGYIPVEPARATSYQRSLANLRAACEHPEVSESFVLFHDDFFVLQPIGEVPVLHLGPLAAQVPPVIPHRARTEPRASYRSELRAAVALLHEWGYAEPLSYDLHVPLPMDKTTTLAVIEYAAGAACGAIRSVYGNVAELGGERTEDVKDQTARGPLPAGPFVSTVDGGFRVGAIGRALRAMFPEPSPYEMA